jgi:putative ABC transport system permease protein
MWEKLPLAWLQLTREKVRFAVAIAGIAFAGILIFVQLGFQDALYEGCTRPHNSLNADLVMVNPQFQTFFSVKSFTRPYLYQALANQNVKSVSGLHVNKAFFKNPETKVNRDILVFASDPLKQPFSLPGLDQQMPRLTMLNRILFDIGSRPEYGPIKDGMQKSGTVATEINNKQIYAAGPFHLGASFAADGNILTSDSTFLRLFPEHKADQIEVGLIKLKPGASPAQVQADLQQHTGPGATVLTIEQFAEREKHYWATSTGIGFIFGLGVVVGFVVGVVIVYQILYSDVCDHLAEYATLKAIGYTNSYLLSVVMKEALILSIFGYIPGVLMAMMVYQIARDSTLIPILTSFETRVPVFHATIDCTPCARVFEGWDHHSNRSVPGKTPLKARTFR